MSEYYESVSYYPPISPEERQRRQINEAVNAAMRSANIQYQSDLSNLIRQHNREKEQLRQKIDSINGQFKESIKQHQQQMEEMREQYDTQLKATIEESEKKRQRDRERFSQELNEAVDIVNANVDDLRQSTQIALDTTNERISSLRSETQNALNEQQKQINSIVEEVHADKAKAMATKKALLESIEAQCSMIIGKNPEKYAPFELSRIQSKLKDIDSIPNEAACSTLYICFNELQTLDVDIEKKRMEYEALHLLTLKNTKEVLARMIEKRKTVTETDGENNVVISEKGEPLYIDFDHWTEGKYGELENTLKRLVEEVENGFGNPSFTYSTLKDKLEMVMQIDKEQNQLVEESIRKSKASKRREKQANEIIDILEGERFRVSEKGYENDDTRNAYFTKLSDNNSKIIVVINPETDNKNHVLIKTIETELTEASLAKQIKDINAILNPAGVSENGICNRHDPEVDEAWQNIDKIDVTHNSIPSEVKKRAKLRDVRAEHQLNYHLAE